MSEETRGGGERVPNRPLITPQTSEHLPRAGGESEAPDGGACCARRDDANPARDAMTQAHTRRAALACPPLAPLPLGLPRRAPRPLPAPARPGPARPGPPPAAPKRRSGDHAAGVGCDCGGDGRLRRAGRPLGDIDAPRRAPPRPAPPEGERAQPGRERGWERRGVAASGERGSASSAPAPRLGPPGASELIMEDSHKNSPSETASQPGSTVQGSHISHITQQASSLSESEESQDSSDSIGSSQKAHGILARRPSYRKILKDLSSEDTRGRKGDGENPGVSALTSMSVPTPIYQTSTGQYIAIAPNGALQLASPSTDGMALTMTNSSNTQQGPTILQYAQTSDGQQILVPSNQVVVQTASGDMQTYQIRTTPSSTSLPQTVVMTSPVTLASHTTKTDDPQLKREIRLMKNREAARECRRKKKEYVKCLENRVAVLENQNKTLIEELKTLKDLYSHKSV